MYFEYENAKKPGHWHQDQNKSGVKGDTDCDRLDAVICLLDDVLSSSWQKLVKI